MTIPEAVQLIIHTGTLARVEADLAVAPGTGEETPAKNAASAGAEVFVLDMGEPVRIVELAREMIELSGLDPDRDIEIEIVGRRPGEKLHEELFNRYERPRQTSAEKILLAEREPLGAAAVESMFAEISLLVLEGDAAGLAAKVSELSAARGSGEVPTAHRAGKDSSAPEDLPPSMVVTGIPASQAPEEPDARQSSGAEEHSAPAPLIHSRDS
jgi:FlaA1/EpsC-like NDP-sugar epimerase